MSQVAVFDGSLSRLSQDGKKVCVSFSGGKIEVRQISGDTTEELSIDNQKIWASTFNPNGDFILARSIRNGIDITNESKQTSQHFDLPAEITTRTPLSEDGRFLACVCRNGNAYILDTENPDKVVEFEQEGWKYGDVFFSPTGNLLATKNQEGVFKFFGREKKNEILRLQGDKTKVSTMAFSSDDTECAIGSENGKIAVLSTGTEEMIGPEIDVKSEVTSIQFLSNDKKIVVFSRDGMAHVYAVGTGVLVTQFLLGEKTISISVSKDGLRIATGSMDSKTRIFDITPKKE